MPHSFGTLLCHLRSIRRCSSINSIKVAMLLPSDCYTMQLLSEGMSIRSPLRESLFNISTFSLLSQHPSACAMPLKPGAWAIKHLGQGAHSILTPLRIPPPRILISQVVPKFTIWEFPQISQCAALHSACIQRNLREWGANVLCIPSPRELR